MPSSVATDVDKPKPLPSLSDHESADKKAEADLMTKMRDYFASQKKVTVKVREQAWVQVNGYTFIIEPDQRVEVPSDVADLLEARGLI